MAGQREAHEALVAEDRFAERGAGLAVGALAEKALVGEKFLRAFDRVLLHLGGRGGVGRAREELGEVAAAGRRGRLARGGRGLFEKIAVAVRWRRAVFRRERFRRRLAFERRGCGGCAALHAEGVERFLGQRAGDFEAAADLVTLDRGDGFGAVHAGDFGVKKALTFQLGLDVFNEFIAAREGGESEEHYESFRFHHENLRD